VTSSAHPHPRSRPPQIRSALEFAARHAEDIDRMLARHEEAVRDAQQAAEQRRAYLT
jgi:hypothetical protein